MSLLCSYLHSRIVFRSFVIALKDSILKLSSKNQSVVFVVIESISIPTIINPTPFDSEIVSWSIIWDDCQIVPFISLKYLPLVICENEIREDRLSRNSKIDFFS